MFGCCMFKRCHPRVRRKREGLLEQDASGVFSAYQDYLGTVQTVSTLLMGFLITGTLLSVSLTGSENYGASQMYEFTMAAVLSTCLSGFSLMLGFIVQARGTAAYENFGAVRAVKSMRRSTMCICLSEMLIYWSLLFFLMSLQGYILMNYIGPDICPYTQQEQPSVESFCSQLGEDFFWAIKKSCETGEIVEAEDARRPQQEIEGEAQLKDRPGHHGVFITLGNKTQRRDRIDSDFVCSQYKYLEQMPRLLDPPLTPKQFAVWDCTMYYEDPVSGGVTAVKDCAGPDHMQLINDVSEVMCSVTKVSELKDRLCGRNMDSDESSQQCAEAFIAYSKALECVDRSLDDARRCFQVCQWTQGEPSRHLLKTQVQNTFNMIYLGLFLTFMGRFLRGLQQTFYVFATDKTPVWRQFLHQLLFRDPESSDEEEDALGGANAEDGDEDLSRPGSWTASDRYEPKGGTRGFADAPPARRGAFEAPAWEESRRPGKQQPPRMQRRPGSPSEDRGWGSDLSTRSSGGSGSSWYGAWAAADGSGRDALHGARLLEAGGVPPGARGSWRPHADYSPTRRDDARSRIPRGWGPDGAGHQAGYEPEPEAPSSWSLW